MRILVIGRLIKIRVFPLLDRLDKEDRKFGKDSKVRLVELPKQSALHRRIESADFIDCYCVSSCLTPRKAAEIITSFPSWANMLLRLRGFVTAPFGLSNDGPDAEDKLGAFPVESETDYELIAGFNDRHLNFRVSVISNDGCVYLATWVHPHNIGGKLYLRAIMPFHIIIARNALKRVHKYNVAFES